MTSAPSVTDIGFSGTRSANSTSADQPVASTIGTSGTSARATPRSAISRTSADGQQPGEQREQPAPVGGDLGVGLGGQDRQAGELRPDARGRPLARRARISSMTAFWRSRAMKRMPKASVAVFRSAVMTDWEKYGGTASSSAWMPAASRATRAS